MKTRLTALLDSIRTSSIVIVGDLMLDEYIIGDSRRISPEAPEPVIEEKRREYVPGGAANVAVNVTALGGTARLIGMVGKDSDGAMFRSTLSEKGVGDGSVFPVGNRPTTRKTRLIARGNQVLRVDHESVESIESDMEQRFIETVADSPEEVVVISDYAKGVVTPGLVAGVVKTGKRIVVDPKSADFSRYAGVDLITPNFSELCRAAGTESLSLSEIEPAARGLMARHDITSMLITLGADGMLLIEGDEPATHIHTRAREVYDVTGAGDTVIACITAAIAAGAPLINACHLATFAAGIVVGKHRTATATPAEILAYAFGPTTADKIMDRQSIAARVEELKRAGRRIVFTNGCFDLLHIGHITYLNDARALGDILVVGLNTDASVRRLKGQKRPIIPEEERSHVLAALESVDFVVLFDEDTPLELIRAVKPDILAKGADYTREGVVGYDVVESYGGKVRLIPLVDNTSTSSIIERIKSSES